MDKKSISVPEMRRILGLGKLNLIGLSKGIFQNDYAFRKDQGDDGQF